jgi:antitoxin MazE
MQIAKWGNSLAIRLPASVVEALKLREGDEVEIKVASKGEFRIAQGSVRDRAVEGLRQLGWHLPANFKFNRDEANER